MSADPYTHDVGDRVQWRREIYRARYAMRPIDHGTVIAVDGSVVKVRADHDGSVVTGQSYIFHALTPLEDNRGSAIRRNGENDMTDPYTHDTPSVAMRAPSGYATRERMNDYVGSPIFANVSWSMNCPENNGVHSLGRLSCSCLRCGAVPTISYLKGNR